MNDLLTDDEESECTKDIASSLQDDGEQAFPASGMATGMASVMAKILCRNVNNSKSVILAKCKTDQELSRKKRASKSSDRVELDPVKELQSAKVRKDLITKKRHWEELGHVKPNVLDRDRERNLQRIATKGVVQLFNAVHKQQMLLEGRLAEAGPSERRREKAVQSLTKGRFLDMLKNVKADGETAPVQVKTEPADETDATETSAAWSILRDDFMIGAKMKDWDKQTNGDDVDNVPMHADSDAAADDDDDSNSS